jgi:hypothetical protein
MTHQAAVLIGAGGMIGIFVAVALGVRRLILPPKLGGYTPRQRYESWIDATVMATVVIAGLVILAVVGAWFGEWLFGFSPEAQ